MCPNLSLVNRTVVLGRIVLLVLLMLVAATSVILPAQARSKNPPPWTKACYEVVGIDLKGVSHAVFLYGRGKDKWPLTNLAAKWLAEGWTGIRVELC